MVRRRMSRMQQKAMFAKRLARTQRQTDVFNRMVFGARPDARRVKNIKDQLRVIVKRSDEKLMRLKGKKGVIASARRMAIMSDKRSAEKDLKLERPPVIF